MTDPVARTRELLAVATRLASAIERDVRAGKSSFIPPDNQEGLFATRHLLYVVRDSAPVLVEAPTLLADLVAEVERLRANLREWASEVSQVDALRAEIEGLRAEREMVARCEPYREFGACHCSTGIPGPCAALSDTGGKG